MKNNINVVFLGTPDFAATALSALLKVRYNVIGVVTQPDRKSGRGNQLSYSAVKELAMDNNLTVHQPENKNELTGIIRQLSPDICIVAAYGIIIEKAALDIPKYGFLNIHGSILPEYRGPSPVTAAMLDGKTETGVTIMQVSEKMDTGDILTVSKTKIDDSDDAITLMDKLAKLGAELLVNTIPEFVGGKLEPIQQDDAKATYCKLVHKEDGEITASDTADMILRKIRAYTPWPGVYIFHNDKRIKIIEAKVTQTTHKKQGFFVDESKLILGTPEGSLEILILQPEGKKPMTAKEYLNGLSR